MGHDWSELKDLSFKDWLKVVYGMVGSAIVIIVVIYCLVEYIIPILW